MNNLNVIKDDDERPFELVKHDKRQRGVNDSINKSSNHYFGYEKKVKTYADIMDAAKFKFAIKKNDSEIHREYEDRSVIHLFLGGEEKQLVRFCQGGSLNKVGCDWKQFGNKSGEGLTKLEESVKGMKCFVRDNRLNKTTYYSFQHEEDVKKIMAMDIQFENKKIELYQTVSSQEDITTISIPSTESNTPEDFAVETCKKLTEYGDLIDMRMKVIKGTEMYQPFGIQVLMLKKKEAVLPSFLEINGEQVGMFYNGCSVACNYCKKSGHWKSNCPELVKKEAKKIFDKKEKKRLANEQKLAVKTAVEKLENSNNVNTRIEETTVETVKIRSQVDELSQVAESQSIISVAQTTKVTDADKLKVTNEESTNVSDTQTNNIAAELNTNITADAPALKNVTSDKEEGEIVDCDMKDSTSEIGGVKEGLSSWADDPYNPKPSPQSNSNSGVLKLNDLRTNITKTNPSKIIKSKNLDKNKERYNPLIKKQSGHEFKQ